MFGIRIDLLASRPFFQCPHMKHKHKTINLVCYTRKNYIESSLLVYTRSDTELTDHN